MKPETECDPSCQSRRFWMCLVYMAFLITCVFLTLCHFLFSMFVRRLNRKGSTDSRYYYYVEDNMSDIGTDMASEQGADGLEMAGSEISENDLKIVEVICNADSNGELNSTWSKPPLWSVPTPSKLGPLHHKHRSLRNIQEEFGNIVDVQVLGPLGQGQPESWKHVEEANVGSSLMLSQFNIAVASVSAMVDKE